VTAPDRDPDGLPVVDDRPEPAGAGADGATGGDRAREGGGAGGMNFGAVLRATRGHRDDLPPPPDFDAPPEDLAERCRRALYEVADPEFPISLVDLGLIYGVEADEAAGRVTVRLTFTATACPCTDFIEWDVRERLEEEPGVEEVEIEVVWDPPWTTDRITDRGREILGRAGVSA
jgi:metal-sulfur cluster biosynthetic enzyme